MRLKARWYWEQRSGWVILSRRISLVLDLRRFLVGVVRYNGGYMLEAHLGPLAMRIHFDGDSENATT
ncbi:hypothetical protein [Pararhodobacter sp.]|uniref:hypothetical protein n=1 Tax=Pararhodobacter sp. TaxID=2127056 RepID=UPI002AFE0C5B|nr:hypothetical protein [Pararhodobacter sp.]